MHEKEYFSVKEFASKVGLHPNSIRKAIKEKRIDAVRFGKSAKAVYRIPISEITRIIKFDFDTYIDQLVEQRINERKLKV